MKKSPKNKFRIYIMLITWIFALSLCNVNQYYTIHGLWGTNSWCKNEPFNIQSLEPIRQQLDKAWMSCTWNNTWLWKHEWDKHGSCFNMTQLEYFNTTLGLWYDFAGLCDLFNGGQPNCYLDISQTEKILPNGKY